MRTKIEIHDFTIYGAGPLPLDMCRYDRCWPMTEGDAGVAENHDGPRSIRMSGLNHPNRLRWESFGWRVMEA